jgi:mono/diheme cytochrome c family protein
MIDYRTGVVLWFACIIAARAVGQTASSVAEDAGDSPLVQFVDEHCFACHGYGSQEGGLAIDQLLTKPLGDQSERWESVVHKLVSRQMPPASEVRPEEEDYDSVVSLLVKQLDRNAQDRPNPGRTATFRRLNRTEYQNAIRDLLSLEIDADQLLPSDDASHGFDNITVTGLSPVLLDRYVSAAQQISRLAIGARAEPAAEKTYRVRPDITQDTHLLGAPIGTRGGMVERHDFPQEGEYEIQAWLMRDRNEELEGQSGIYQLDVILDRERVGQFTIERPAIGADDKSVDAELKTRVHVSAGPHEIGVVFLRNSSPLLETVRQPLNVHYNFYRHPRIEPAVYQVTIRGPFDAVAASDTPSRRRIFVCYPRDDAEHERCAEQILSTFMRRAYRRDVNDIDLQAPMKFFHEGQQAGGFDVGIERAICAVLVNPQFLFRIERDAEGIAPGAAYQVSDVELAARLSFFLWSSIPDDELRDLAVAGRLREPGVLETQVRRMLADERCESLSRNFAGQWLYLRNLDSVIPDMRLYPDFDDNLRQALRRETELLFASIVREDRSVLDLIDADFTYLDERLAKHYGIPHVYGSRFRRVALGKESRRGGLLRQGSILTVTSYATRTSPVLRGKWVLENLLGSPPPPPPPDVPPLVERTVSGTLAVRERLAQHRADATCARCHDRIDPVGLALENFDAVGRWRDSENGEPVSAAGGLPDGSRFEGVSGLEQALLNRPEIFAQTLTEKLMTFALGRGLEHYDAPAVRRVVRDAREKDYRFSEIVLGIVDSVPFQMRTSQ